ncbi:SMI1/KNR4 family protein [Gilliamella sp. B3791]|nr:MULTISPECIES: SMI1/KNR4 family protein [unclassified Gilliamella]MCX8642549.1 SMI1/KNR4 family protein [Gilliamella sp. B3835]MCX8706403.1 SMI1/KNR4 family protein [Gilliamella sp. B3783]MCX8717135.1 SMI1/KNR4 family protein [Gilliamella sp. B3784]MCX8717932.1 SMI1/KNR4 family protein [Gilliamella sp. B3788]MCX8729193.1 SMI1/KNR4 family protein [Gilliamella sp. B2969]
MFTSKYSVPNDIDKRITKLNLNTKINHAYIEFLKQYNVIILNDEAEIDYCINCDGEALPLEVIFGFSKKDTEDLLAINDSYLDRIPENYLAIASLNYGDLLCLSPKGKIYHWDHEVNDLYFDMKGGYLEQNTNLKLVANDIDALLAMITRTEVEDDYDPDEDDYNNPNIPFPDDTLDSFIEYPKRISIIPENRLAIYLKKMELSEKGREVLTKLREQGVII